MDYDIKENLRIFLHAKMRKIFEETREDKPTLDFDFIKTVKGFEKSDIKNPTYGYEFFNCNGHRCFIYFTGKNNQPLISIRIGDITSNGWYGTYGMLYRCMDEIDDIAKELHQLNDDLTKQAKINEIAKNSTKTWLKAIMQNQPYAYYTTEYKNKITLSVKLKNRMQLDIPIYFSRFQKIMPELLNTIRQYEKTVNENKIKVLISNSQPNQTWICQ